MAIERMGFPAVVKPARGNQARGVTAGLRTPEEVGPAFERAASEQSGVVVERGIVGTNYRLLVIAGRFVAALACLPPTVTGDGQRSIRELIRALNQEPDRDDLRLSSVVLDADLDRQMRLEGCVLEDVLIEGRTIPLRATGNIATGGGPVDVSDIVHPDHRQLAERAALGVGLDIVGVDYISTDIALSYRDVGGSIVDVNSRPDLCAHVWPRSGFSRDVASPILDFLFPDGSSGSVSTLLIAGDRGTRRVGHATEALLRSSGLTVGLALKDEAYLNGRALGFRGRKLQRAARTLLRDPALECLVSAVSLRKAIRYGLCVDTCDAAAILPGEHEQHIPSYVRGIDVLVKATRGRFVVMSDDETALAALGKVDPQRLILVAAKPNDVCALSQTAQGSAAVGETWREGRTHVAAFAEGRMVMSVPLNMQTGSQAQTLALALVYAAGLTPKIGHASL